MQEDDIRSLAKIIDFFRGAAVVLLLLHCYWYCYEAFFLTGYYNAYFNQFLSLLADMGLFDDYLMNKFICIGILALSCLGNKGVKSEKITWLKIGSVGTVGALFFFFNEPLLTFSADVLYNAFLYAASAGIGFIGLLTAGGWISRRLNNDLMKDVFNEENESFMQETRLIENEYSVNLKTRFRYQKKGDYPQFCVNTKLQEPNPGLNPDSVFKYSQKLIKNQSPVPYGLIPFFLNFANSQINRLLKSFIIREGKLVFSVFADLPVQILYKISRIDDFSYFNGEIKERGQFIPISSP